MDKRDSIIRLLAGVFVVLLCLLVAILFRYDVKPGTNSPEAGFARDMSTHHQQAVEMSFLVRQNSDDQEINAFAYDILNTQATQRGMMRGWLQLWDVPQFQSGPPMQWAGGMESHATSGSSTRMAGMATESEMQRLANATGNEAEKLFLELMIDHHIGGVDMAEAVLERSDHPVVTRLAEKMVSGQEVEVMYMRDLLSEY
jgi:uncharacterized protein (DUF305 family)